MKSYRHALENVKLSSWSDFFKIRVFDIEPQDIKLVILGQDRNSKIIKSNNLLFRGQF